MSSLNNKSPTLALRALLDRIEEAALATGIKANEFRLDYKRNKKGELVVANLIKDGTKGFSSISIP